MQRIRGGFAATAVTRDGLDPRSQSLTRGALIADDRRRLSPRRHRPTRRCHPAATALATGGSRAISPAFPAAGGPQAVRGEVIVKPMAGSYLLQVEASGMAPGSAHSVHLHFGSCPSAGVHLAEPGTMIADGAGKGSLAVTLGVPYRGDGRFVIVYVGPSAGSLAACAQLAD